MAASLPRSVLQYVDRALGRPAMIEVCRRAGADPVLAEPVAEAGWVSEQLGRAIFVAAAEVTRDPSVGRAAGEEMFRRDRDAGHLDLLTSQDGPGAAIAVAVHVASRMSTYRRFAVRDPHELGITVVATDSDVAAIKNTFCQHSAGYWASIVTLFGGAGTAVHDRCRDLGDEECRWTVRWEKPVAAAERERERSRSKLQARVDRFSALQEIATELVLADDIPEILDCVVRRIGIGVTAPRILVTVRDRHGAIDSAGVGFDPSTRQVAAEALWSGATLDPSWGAPQVVEITSDRQQHGYLAMFSPGGSAVLDFEQRFVDGFADHVAAAIDRTLLRQAAQRDHRTASGVLRLARLLASAASVPDVCQRLVDNVPGIVGADHAAVRLWDPAAEGYTLQAATPGWSSEAARAYSREELSTIDVSDSAAPISLAVARLDGDPDATQRLARWGLADVETAPIRLRGELLGLISVGVRNALDEGARRTLRERIMAVADHAATALDSAMLFEKVSHQAHHDALTGLPNRTLAERRIGETLAAPLDPGRSHAVLFVDLDRFKNVNDTLGHAAGDDLIRQVARRLSDLVRRVDTVARLGGDEFIVFLDDLRCHDDASAVADKIIAALREPFVVEGQQLFISCSIGIACWPDHGADFGELLSRADAAMYRAKAYGRATFAVHAEEQSYERLGQLQLENDLHRAVADHQLVVLYQSQVDMRTMRTIGVEALVRWDHPTRGRLAPDAFLDLAEESGMIVEIDRWVRREALWQARQWADRGMPLRMSLNLSTRDLRNPQLATEIGELIDETGVDAALVELEVTDRVAMGADLLPEILAPLKALGVTLAIDDFGTGTSVLSRLQRCPVDVLKIDRSFIDEMSHGDSRLVHALVSMAHALGLAVVGEGIETLEQAGTLRGYGCDVGQGYLFTRPVEASELVALIDSEAVPEGVPR